MCCINYGPTSTFRGISRTRIISWQTFSTYWASISLRVSFVMDRECTLLRTSASSSSYRLFFDAWTREISFKTSYIAFVASGMYLPYERNYITVCDNRETTVQPVWFTCSNFVSSPAAREPEFFLLFWISAGCSIVE